MWLLKTVVSWLSPLVHAHPVHTAHHTAHSHVAHRHPVHHHPVAHASLPHHSLWVLAAHPHRAETELMTHRTLYGCMMEWRA